VIKTIPTIPRLLAMIFFALASFGALLFLWVSFGGPVPLHPKGYRFNVDFPKAAQLTRQADVRISGVTVGKVVALEALRDNSTRATIELEPKYAPIPVGAKAMLRAKTLLGETFVELAPNRAKSSGSLPEDGILAKNSVSPTVELDDLLKVFDPQTRAAFRQWQQTQAAATRGRGADFNETIGELPEFVDQMDQLATTIDAQGSAVKQSVSNTATVFEALGRRQGDLRNLVAQGDKVFSAIGARNDELAAVFEAFPRFEQEVARTLPQVTALGDRATPVVERLQPAATELAPTFDALNRLSPDLEAFMNRLGPVITASQKGLPAFDRILDQLPPVLDAFIPFTRTANPLLRQIGINKQEFTAFLGNVTAASNARDISSRARYLRVGVNLSPQGLAYQKRLLGQNRRNAYVAPGGGASLIPGLKVLDTQGCTNGDPGVPTGTDEYQRGLLVANLFHTDSRAVARPGCTPQGNYPGFSTVFPRLGADAPVDQGASK
jgi:phospholipid/cholesterol/gamma-HCH transport system substrate-binding protein